MATFRFAGQLRVGIDAVRNAKMRSFWTMLGIIIGVFAVISILAIGEGIKEQIGGQIHDYGSNLITVRTAELTAGSGSSSNNISALSGFSIAGPLTQKDINTVSRVNNIEATAPLTIVSGTVKGVSGVYSDGFVIGTSSSLPSLLNQSLAYGSMFSNGSTAENVAVLGQHAADQLFNEDVPLGRGFSFRGQNFIVDGIFNQFSTTPLSQQANFNNAIFIPNEEAEALTNGTAPTYEILARANSSSSVAMAANNIKAALNYSHGGQSGFSVLTGNQSVAENNSVLNLLTKLIAGVAALSLLVAGIGIMNVMIVSVAERIREIGIRKAVGATNRQILSQFIAEATMLSLTGGVIGIILAYALEFILRFLTDLRPVISWQIVVLAAGVSLLVGIVFGTVPALKAARKDPIEALRAE